MSRYFSPSGNDHHHQQKTAVLLTNLGTPNAPTAGALRVYLKQFLADPRVIEMPRLLWLLVLKLFILPFRSEKSAKLYQSIWTEQGSPMRVIAEQQKIKFEQQIKKYFGESVIVDMAMRYGDPAIAQALKHFQQCGVNKIIVLPLYPQYSGPTTGSTFDAVYKEIKSWRWVPSVHFISGYHNTKPYIHALANSVQQHIDSHGKPDKLVLSYHGMPQAYFDKGDPYYTFCQQTTQLLAEQLGLSEDDYLMTFQSRFGKAQWLKPYTSESLTKLAQQGNKNIAIISPAFSADCLETLEELVHENKQIFIDAGGERYHYIQCLNDDERHIDALVHAVNQHI